MKSKFIRQKNKINDKCENSNVISVKNSIFRCSGGGQDEDRGEIFIEELKESFSVIPKNKCNKVTMLKLSNDNLFSKVKKGMRIEERVNKKRREIQSKTHTAEHLLVSQIKKLSEEKEIKLGKVNIKNGEGDIFIKTEMNKKDLFKLLKKAQINSNKLIKKGKKVKKHIFTSKEINKLEEKFPKIRIKKDRIEDEEIKVVEIKDIDYSACKGTHVNNISEIKQIGIIDVNKNNNEYKIKFTIQIEKINTLKDTLLEFKFLNNVKIEDLNKNYENLIEERDHFRNKINKILPLVWEKSEKIEYKEKSYDVIKLEGFKVNKLMNLTKNKENFIIINISEKGVNIISNGIDLSFIDNYKGKLSKEKSILFVDDKTRKKIEKEINKKEINFTI